MNSLEHEHEQPPIRLYVPERLLVVGGAATVLGMVMGMTRGGRKAAMQYLAENAHAPPKTVKGWYFYNRTKNYKVMLGGLKGGGKEGLRLGLTAAGWVGIEEGLERTGWGDVSSLGAGLGTAATFSLLYRMNWKRTMLLGLVAGGGVQVLRLGRAGLASRLQ